MPFPILPSNSATGYFLTNSLRFRASVNANLSKTFASAGNQKTWTMSFWVKRGKLGFNAILGSYASSADTGNFEFRFTSSDTLQCYLWNGGTTTNAVFRDPSAWYHIVLVIDTTQAGTSSGSKIKMYVNNVLQTFSSDYISTISQNTNLIWNATTAEYIGRWYASDGGTYTLDCYMDEVNFIDGQALTPSSFGSTNSLTGVWQPAKYTGTYGTNGFYLPFTNTTSTSTLGNDFSGNGNNWTTNNFSLTAGTTYDSMTDVPTLTNATTANYCVLNPLRCGSLIVPTQGNLSGVCTGTAAQTVAATFGVSSGKYYWEVTNTGTGLNYIGIVDGNAEMTTYIGSAANGNGWAYNTAGQKVGPTSGTVALYGATYTNGDLIGVALDMDAGTIVFYKNNSSQGTMVTGLTGTWFPAVSCNGLAGNGGVFNFGQRPFTYTPPTGFVALNAFNLPTSTIVKGNTYMDVTTYTGNGSAGRVITMSNMTNVGFAWVKLRSGSDDHRLANTVTGGNRHLKSNATDAVSTGTNVIQAFSSNTFTVGSDVSVNGNGSTYVGWVWANDGTAGSSNTAGSVTSTVSANTTAGFSVAIYTTPASGAFTVGHGLGVAPSFIINKIYNIANNWYCYHVSLGNGSEVILNTLGNAVSTSDWNNTSPTSSVFSMGSGWAGSYSMISYCWAEIAGYSKFGNYVGNGSSDGPFVYTGFRPKFVIFKSTGVSANDWIMYDTSRNTYNVMGASLVPNSAAAENAISLSNENTVDFLSNGFKLRAPNYANNGPSVPYIYMAFAENPFKNALAR